jgi:enoyl-CoA hydratase/carnithine racemase
VSSQERVELHRHGHVWEVRLSRPDKLNAFDLAMFRALAEAGRELAGRPDARAVVLTASGRAFSAGLDLANFAAMRDGAQAGGLAGLTEARGRLVHDGQLVVWQWQQLAVPVIAAVSGVAYGAGLQLALGADMRVVAPGARLALREVNWGLVPDMGATVLLPPLVGPELAKELIWTGREVSGEEAVRIRLASRLSDDPAATALELAQAIAAQSPDAVRGAKRLINLGLDEGSAAGLAAERREIKALAGTPNQREAAAAFFERRPPTFTDASPASS